MVAENPNGIQNLVWCQLVWSLVVAASCRLRRGADSFDAIPSFALGARRDLFRARCDWLRDVSLGWLLSKLSFVRGASCGLLCAMPYCTHFSPLCCCGARFTLVYWDFTGMKLVLPFTVTKSVTSLEFSITVGSCDAKFVIGEVLKELGLRVRPMTR